MSKATAGGSTPPLETVARFLRDVDLPTDRFIKVKPGEKEPTERWGESANQYEPDNPELLAHVEQGGNVGIVCGRGLVVVDVDDREAAPDELEDLPGTLTVRSGGGGTHLYYRSEWTDTKDHGGGEIRADGGYVVAPGADHPTGGTYTIEVPAPPTSAPADAIGTLVESPDGSTGTDRPAQSTAGDTQRERGGGSRNATGSKEAQPEPGQDTTETVTTSGKVTLTDDERDRLRTMFDSENGDRIRALWEGRYRAAGFGTDRSRGEQALVSYLGWWFGDDKETVARLMTVSCREYPQTGTGDLRKWKARPDSYRRSTLDTGLDHATTYSPPSESDSFEDRPDVGWPLKERVIDAVRDLDRPTVGAINDHNRIDRSDRQVLRARRELEDSGYLDTEPDPDDGRTEIYRVVDLPPRYPYDPRPW